MKTQAISQSRRQKPFGFYNELFKLTVVGGIVFWSTTIATSLLPIATSYRAAFSNWSIQTVWIDSLFMGMIIGCCVSYALLRFNDEIPTNNSILKSVMLSTLALIFALVLVDVPMISRGSSDALHYFLIGAVFNTIRFLLLGIAIGCVRDGSVAAIVC